VKRRSLLHGLSATLFHVDFGISLISVKENAARNGRLFFLCGRFGLALVHESAKLIDLTSSCCIPAAMSNPVRLLKRSVSSRKMPAPRSHVPATVRNVGLIDTAELKQILLVKFLICCGLQERRLCGISTVSQRSQIQEITGYAGQLRPWICIFLNALHI
jgi:hypothetical protein